MFVEDIVHAEPSIIQIFRRELHREILIRGAVTVLSVAIVVDPADIIIYVASN